MPTSGKMHANSEGSPPALDEYRVTVEQSQLFHPFRVHRNYAIVRAETHSPESARFFSAHAQTSHNLCQENKAHQAAPCMNPETATRNQN